MVVKALKIQADLHAARICDEDLQAVPDSLIHPLLTLFRGDLRREDLRAVSILLHQL